MRFAIQVNSTWLTPKREKWKTFPISGVEQYAWVSNCAEYTVLDVSRNKLLNLLNQFRVFKKDCSEHKSNTKRNPIASR